MKTGRILSILLATAVAPLFAQIYSSSPSIAITDNTGTLADCDTINVSHSTNISNVTVEIDADHSWVGDLTFRLESPNATQLTFINRAGRTGTGAGFSDDLVGGTPIGFGDTVPANPAEQMGDDALGCTGGTIQSPCPEEYFPDPDASDLPIAGVGTLLSDFDGENPMGTWTLCVGDSAGGDTGTLNQWRLGFDATPVPVEAQSASVE